MKDTAVEPVGLPEAPMSRRQILQKAAVGSISLAAASTLLAGCGGSGTSSGIGRGDNLTDVEVLQFALNLEYLEAEFYTYATTGAGIGAAPFNIALTGRGNSGATTGGAAVPGLSGQLLAVAQELADDERDHVRLLRGVLGANAIAKPAINLNALGFGFGNVTEFLRLARIFEDLGVGAYAGAASSLQTKSTLEVAARILAAEAYHAGNIRLQVANAGVTTTAVLPGDILPPPSGTKYFAVDDNTALSFAFTPAQVLAVAGPFFPNGINGDIDLNRSR